MTEAQDPNQYVTLEITLPRASAEGMTALRGMVTALGWQARERPTLLGDLDYSQLPRLWRIDDEQFLETSRELWGSEDYGKSAAAHLRRERRSIGGVLWSNGLVNMEIAETLGGVEIDGVPIVPLYVGGAYQPTRPPYKLSDAAMARRAQFLWNLHHHPFIVRTSIKDYRGDERTMELFPGDITRERLADYARNRKYDEHTLHGAIGKMLDVVTVTAGVIEKQDIGEREVEGDFIEPATLRRMMAEEGLSTHMGNGIRKKLAKAIGSQLASGKPCEYGEVVLEGSISSEWEYDRIAASSLAAIVHSFKSKKETPVTRFLKQFA